jgi:hypothetical protein
MNWPIVFSSASSISVISEVRGAGAPVPPSRRSIKTRATGRFSSTTAWPGSGANPTT